MALGPQIAELMTPDPHVLAPTDSVGKAVRLMEVASIRHLPIVDTAGALVGVVSQRDLLTARDGDCRLADVMSRDLVTVAAQTPAHAVAALMLHHKIGCVPVVGPGGALCGIVTDSDLVRAACVLLGGNPMLDELTEVELDQA